MTTTAFTRASLLLQLPATRLKYYRWLLAVCFSITLIFSWVLWNADREFPTAPLFGTFSLLHGSIGAIYRVLLLVCGVLLVFEKRWIWLMFILLMLVGFVDDLNRVRPDYYLYFLIVAYLYFARNIAPKKLLSSFRILTGGVYLWTGICKFNLGFVESISLAFFNAFHLNPSNEHAKYVVLIVPVVEVLIGLAYLLKKHLRFTATMAFMLHIVIVVQLVASHWNNTMIVFNAFLAFGNLLLFWQHLPVSSLYDTLNTSAWPQRIAALLMVALPSLSLFHWWPTYMSASMYSGNSLKADVYSCNKLEEKFPIAADVAGFDTDSGSYISLNNWFGYTTGCVPNPEKYVYNKMFLQLKHRYNLCDSAKVVMRR